MLICDALAVDTVPRNLATALLLRDVAHRNTDFVVGRHAPRRERVRLGERLVVVGARVLIGDTVARWLDANNQHVRRCLVQLLDARACVRALIRGVGVVELTVHIVVSVRLLTELEHDSIAGVRLEEQR